MKYFLISFLLLFIVVLLDTNCSKSKSTSDLLKNEIERDKIMTFISNDSIMTSDMIDHFVIKEKTTQRIRNMVKSLMTKDYISQLMKNDQEFTNEMMCSVMEMAVIDTTVCRNLTQTIEKYNLQEKLGIDLTQGKSVILKDKVLIHKPVKTPHNI